MIEISNITKVFSSYVSTPNSTKIDFIIGLMALVFFYLCWSFYIPFSETGKYTTDIELGYSAKQDEEGYYYVVDLGHNRLVCFDEDSNIRYEIDNVSDNESSGLYISDFCVDNGLTYMSVGEWNGMLLSKEAILVFDKEKYLRTITVRDYSKEIVNKPRFHDITVKDNILRYVEAEETNILIHTINLETEEDSYNRIEYYDAFNAINNCVFYGETLYILNKYGIINSIKDGKVEQVYSTKWQNEKERIPHQMVISENGEIYFIDIRSREIVQVNVDTKSTKTVFDQTDALTINLTKSGNEFLVVDIIESGMKVISNEKIKKFLTLNENFNQVAFKIIFNCMEIMLVMSLLLLIYRAYIIILNKDISNTNLIASIIIVIVFIVSIVICKIQIDKFSDTYQQEIMSKLENSAYSLANSMSSQSFEKINNAEDYNGDAYVSLIRSMRNTFPMNLDINHQIYCDILRFDKSSDTVYAMACFDQSTGVYFPILDSGEVEEVKRLYQENQKLKGSLPQIWNMDVADSSGSYISLKIPIYNDDRIESILSLGTDATFIQDKIKDLNLQIILSMIVILLLVWFGIAEAVAWIDGKKTFDKAIEEGNTKALPIHFIRLLIFFIYGCANLSATFLPVWLMNNSTEFQSNQEFMAALPFTINIFVIGIMSLVTPMLIRRLGMKHILTLSSIAAFYGNAIVFLIPGSYPVMFFGMLIEGMGNGIIMNATYILLTYIEDEEDKQRSFSVYNIASLAGGNFGFMLGSILAILLSQRLTFLIIALMWLSMAIMSNVILLQLKNLISTDEETEEEEDDKNKSISIRQFILNRPVLSFMILFQNPYILFSGFVLFFAPIFCENQGYSEIVVSILMMVHAEAAVLSESNLSERITKLKGNMGMYIAYFLNISAVMLFVLINDIFGLALALIIMGIAAGFGITLEQMWFIKLKPSQQYGEDNAMSIYAFTENIGESLGPMVFARLMTLEPIIASVSTFCAVVGALGFGHMIFNKKEIAEFSQTDEEENN